MLDRLQGGYGRRGCVEGKRDKLFGVFGRKDKAAPVPAPRTPEGNSQTLGNGRQRSSRPRDETPVAQSEVKTDTDNNGSTEPSRPHSTDLASRQLTPAGPPAEPSQELPRAEATPGPAAEPWGRQEASSPALGEAHSAAWNKLSKEDQALLTQDADIKELFVGLEKANEDHRHDNVLRRGMIAAKPWLHGIQGAIDLSGPFLSLEPMASNAMGLVGGCLSIATALCGAVDGITPQIGAFMERIPVIKRCDEVIKIPSQLQDIHETLVAMYTDLFRFYLLASRMFRESKFMLQMLKNVWKPEMSEVMDSYKGHAGTLSMLLESETFASVQEIKEEQADALIRDTLDTDRKTEIHYHNQLRQRTDDACHWILEDQKFNTWRSTPRPGMLVMLGNMGSGKTMMSAFVADTLSKVHTTCAFYCKDDGETNRLVSVYRSFVWQLLKRRPNLKPVFRKWYEYANLTGTVDATQDVEKIEEFLLKAITDSETWTFLVVDGLDECSFATRKRMLSLFEKSFDQTAKLKVFVSSRYNAEVDVLLPKETEKLHFAPSTERDRLLTTYLVGQSAIPDKVAPKVIEVLSTSAQGSAIWLRIALEYLAKCLVGTERGVDRALAQLTASKDLAGMYWNLYDQMFSELPEFHILNVQIALEILATAHRPLTGSELSVAVYTNREDEPAETIEELQEISTDFDLVGKIRPFISASKDEEGREHGLRLVHQSLKELVLKAPPSGWQEASKARKTSDDRRRVLEAEMMKRCIRYLLYDECNEVNIAEKFDFYEHEADFEMLGMFGGGIDDENARSEDGNNAGTTDMFDPAEAGLGSFYAYAAVYWCEHYAEIDPKAGAPERDDVIAICTPGSNRLINWLEMSRRPEQTVKIQGPWPEYTNVADPLLITASLGCPELVPYIMGDNLDAPEFLPNTLWEATQRLMRRDATDVLIELMKNEVSRDVLVRESTFFVLANRWRDTGEQADKKTLQKRGEVFKFLIEETKTSVLPQAGNEILCIAAKNGCLPLLEKLFEAAAKDAALRDAILVPARDDDSARSLGLTHQSVGTAIWEGHEDTAAWLCKQKGIEAHLHHVNSQGATVYHQAARRARLGAYELLVKVWPAGINITSEDGSTGLDMLLYNWQNGGKQILGAVRLMVDHGAEFGEWVKTGGDGGGPVCFARKGAGEEVCKLLMGEGREHTCRPRGVGEVGT